MIPVPSFGLYLRHTDGPRRLSDVGPATSAEAWAASYLCVGDDTDDACFLGAFEVLDGWMAYAREPGTLGEYVPADTVEPDEDDRILTVDDLVGFGSDE